MYREVQTVTDRGRRSNGLYFLTLPLVSVMRVIYRKIRHARYLYIKRNVEKVWGARYTWGARYLSKKKYVYILYYISSTVHLLRLNDPWRSWDGIWHRSSDWDTLPLERAVLWYSPPPLPPCATVGMQNIYTNPQLVRILTTPSRTCGYCSIDRADNDINTYGEKQEILTNISEASLNDEAILLSISRLEWSENTLQCGVS